MLVVPSKYAGTSEFTDLLFDQHAQMSMILLRGHLLLEQALTAIIELRGERASVVVDRASFSAKLNVCDGLGLIDEELATAVRLVNRERNHLAHRLDAFLTFERVSALKAHLPEGFVVRLMMSLRSRLISPRRVRRSRRRR